MAFCVDGSMAGNRFDEEKPVLVGEIQHDVGHLAVEIDGDTEHSQPFFAEISVLRTGIPDIDDLGAEREVGCECLDDVADKLAVGAGRDLDFIAGRDG